MNLPPELTARIESAIDQLSERLAGFSIRKPVLKELLLEHSRKLAEPLHKEMEELKTQLAEAKRRIAILETPPTKGDEWDEIDRKLQDS